MAYVNVVPSITPKTDVYAPHAHRLFGNLHPGKMRYLKEKKNFLDVELYLVATRTVDKKWVIVATSYAPEKALERYTERWHIETL